MNVAPSWPLLLDEAGVAKYLSLTPAKVKALVSNSLIPSGRTIAPGVVRWHQQEIEVYYRRMYGLDALEQLQQAASHAAMQSLDRFAPTVRARSKVAG